MTSRTRKFDRHTSAGLRIRVHPTLQSEQIGMVPVGGTVDIMDELSNSDGLWVRLSQESLIGRTHFVRAPDMSIEQAM